LSRGGLNFFSLSRGGAQEPLGPENPLKSIASNQFLETGTSDITFMGRNQELE